MPKYASVINFGTEVRGIIIFVGEILGIVIFGAETRYRNFRWRNTRYHKNGCTLVTITFNLKTIHSCSLPTVVEKLLESFLDDRVSSFEVPLASKRDASSKPTFATTRSGQVYHPVRRSRKWRVRGTRSNHL